MEVAGFYRETGGPPRSAWHPSTIVLPIEGCAGDDFATVIPSGDACSAGDKSWLMEIDSLSGSRLAESPFDLNRDHSFDESDFARLDPNDPDSPLVQSIAVIPD